MHITRIDEALPYAAPGHVDVAGRRLQGREFGGDQRFWTALSHFLPGGGAAESASPLERTYVVLSGEMTLIAGGQEATLGPLDSVHLDRGDSRELINKTNLTATMLVVMEYPETAP
jgi:quercetin dioxygenase-like cupin family protein